MPYDPNTDPFAAPSGGGHPRTAQQPQQEAPGAAFNVAAPAEYYVDGQFTPGNVRAPDDYTNPDGSWNQGAYDTAVQTQLGPQMPTVQGDYDLSTQGAEEQYYDAFKGEIAAPTGGAVEAAKMIPGLLAPGQGQQFQAQHGGALAGNMGSGNLAAQAYQDFQGSRPDIAQDAGLDPYYDNAQRKVQEGLAMSSGAAGGYGSSTFQDVNQEAIMNLRAEQANREADYNLRRIGEERNWAGMGLDAANAASQNQLGWANTLGNQALGAEQMDLARGQSAAALARGLGNDRLNQIIAGANIAGGAQRAEEGRVHGLLDATAGFGQGVSNTAGGAFANMTEQDLAFVESQFGLEAGSLKTALEDDRYSDASFSQFMSDINDFQNPGVDKGA